MGEGGEIFSEQFLLKQNSGTDIKLLEINVTVLHVIDLRMTHS